MVFYYIAGYQVGWYEQGLQKSERWYESTAWGSSEDKYFDPFAPIVNREYLDKFPEYKYSAVNLYRGVGRNESTGRGVMFVLRETLKKLGKTLSGTTVAVQGAGNVGDRKSTRLNSSHTS